MTKQSIPIDVSNLLARARRFGRRNKPVKPRRITPAVAARIFKVPIFTIKKMWPNLPLCTPIVVHRKAKDLTQPPSASPVQASINPNDLLTPDELALKLKVPIGWVKEKTRRRNRDPLPSMPMGRYVRYYWLDVCQWLRDRENRGKSK